MTKKLFLAFLLVSLTKGTLYAQCELSNQCMYRFVLTDSFGDGLNGDTMSVFQNGLAVATLAEYSNPNSYQVFPFDVALCHESPFELFWNPGGDFPDETSVKIIDPFGAVIYNKPFHTGMQNTTLYSGVVNCVSSLGTHNSGFGQLIVSPNPASDFFTVENDSGEIMEELSISDISGKKIKTISNPGNKLTIMVSDLQRGIYFIEIKTPEKSKMVKKLILK